ncbi:hypothetical protein [Tenacibaculum aquimarinum]|uniref:hypothetical protein n=1 Tax=Tenacibaculum aquimarinum TaxID=2910675 RepID=UPI001F0A5ABE|nr:hypothetical protein [Tenacibaculum aquimarinum]MCH3884334.1 hypothetical protein [Tenacibaculum aquimarinum]
MIKITTVKSNLIVFGIPLLMIFSMFLLTKSTWFSKYPKELSIGITLDLLFTIPLVYFFSIRKKEIPKITIISLFLIGLVTASFMLPENQQSLLSQIKTYFFPIVELGVLTFLFIKIRQITIEFKKLKTTNLNFFDTVKIACKESFPSKIATLLATEVAVIYYGFFLWKKRNLKENEFSNYKENGLVSVLLVLILIVFIETIAIHKLIEDWNVLLSWILTGTSIYTGLQIFALVKSLVRMPFKVDVETKEVLLQFGFFSKAIIPFNLIEGVEVSTKDLPEDKSIVSFSLLNDLGGHNVIIHLKDEVEFDSFYGFKKKAKSLAISVDKKNEFVGLISEETQKQTEVSK